MAAGTIQVFVLRCKSCCATRVLRNELLRNKSVAQLHFLLRQFYRGERSLGLGAAETVHT